MAEYARRSEALYAPTVGRAPLTVASKGDVITIPAKTPHWFKDVTTKTIAYYAVNTEP